MVAFYLRNLFLKSDTMAIVFIKDISEDKLLTAYNNNVVRFNSDSVLVVATAQITGLGVDVLLYPHPDGSFYFNFEEYFTTEINTKNFIDDLVYDLDAMDSETYTYDVSDGCYMEGDILFKINFVDLSFESVSRNVHLIAGANQLDDYKRNEIVFTPNKLSVLSPVQDRSNNSTFLKYWEGYPFEFTIFNNQFPDAPFTIVNDTNAADYEFLSKGKVTSMFLCDGGSDATIDDFLPLVTGFNKLRFLVEDVDQALNLTIHKAESDCGVYIKFLNKYARWNYWLLSKRHFKNISSKYLAEIDNDYENLEDTISPTLQIGKVSDSTIRCVAERLTEDERLVLSGIIDSPKILLFTGERFTKAELSDWMEVKLKTASIPVETPKNKIITYSLEFDLPLRNTITL